MASAARAEDSSSASVNSATPTGITEDVLSPARNAALRLVSRAEQCTFLLSQKLLKKGFDPGTVKTVVLELVEANVVSDDRFSQMWVRSRIASKADTPRRITAALCAKGIDRGTAVRAVEECLDSETEEALLRRFVQKRLKGLMLETDGYKAVLRGQGFSEDAVQGFLESGDREGE